MDISKYIPVGVENAVQVTVLAGGNSLTGLAWREENTSTEVTLRTMGGALGAGDWAIADTAITALSLPPPLPERSQP